MDKLAELEVLIKTNIDKVTADIDKLKQRSKQTTDESNSAFSGMFRKIKAGYLAAAAVAVGFLSVVNKAISAAKNQAIAEGQVANAVKRTGQQAGYTAKQLFNMASQLQKITGIGDEDILSNVTNQLLTFSNITGVAFNRAQKAILDINAVIAKGDTGSLTSQAIQLGKALNDPVTGLSSLTRIGITFNDQQKEQIKALQESGDLLGAQTIILDELNKEFGGQAEALNKATGGTKAFTTAWGDFLERVGKPLLKILTPILSALTNIISPVQEVITELDGAKSSTAELSTNFDILTSRLLQLKNQTSLTSTEKKILKDTIDELNKTYPNYFKNIDLEKSKYDDVKTSITDARIALDKYVDSVIAAAVIKDLKDNIADVGKKLYESRQALLDNTAAAEKFNKTGIDPFSGLDTKDNANFAESVRKRFESINTIASSQIDIFTKKLNLLQDEVKTAQDTFKDVLAPTSGGNGNTTVTTQSDYITKLIAKGTELQDNLKAVNDKLKDVNLTTAERNTLLKEQADLNQKIIEQNSAIVQADLTKKSNIARTNKPEGTLLTNINPNEVKPVQEIKKPDISKELQAAELSTQQIVSGFQSVTGNAQRISNILGLGADTFIGKLISGLNDAVSIASSVLNIVGSFASGGVLGFLGLNTGGVVTNSGIHKFATGGTVPAGFPNDTYLAGLSSGEVVLNKETVGKLSDILNSVNILNRNLINKNFNSRNTINLNGKQIATVVQNEINTMKKEGVNIDKL